jgi:uncharacterized protein YcaQ
MATTTNTPTFSALGPFVTADVERLRNELAQAQSENAALRAAVARIELDRDRYLKAIYDLKRDSLCKEITAEFGDDLDPESLARKSAGPATFFGTHE